MDPSRGPQSHSAEPAKDQHADSAQQAKSRLGPAFQSLSRCSACYNHNKNSKRRWGGGSESSSSAEDSGPDVEVDSEEESSSSCSSVEDLAAETSETERQSAAHEDAAEPEPEGQDVNGRQETRETVQSQGNEKQAKGTTRRAPLVKSYSLPASFNPRLVPVSLLPRPPRVISTLHLQVGSQMHDKDIFFPIRQRLNHPTPF
ncbi:uncharacterized protein LOC114447629 [Parambassis ranga]|uniref:Uncharacterized protein LOC114447629 n=1 Tax=Parambassis ranga TaxID=210632 RepID=A0A6P7JSD2_9TELE|nr:uncharacterized protein LOC114447629 [Parambassis ranga]